MVSMSRAALVATDLLAVTVLVFGLYFPRYRRRDMVVAILDTNEDGEYDLFEDWWGYFRDAVDAVVEVRAGSPLGAFADPPINPMPTDIDFSLQPPGFLDPGFGYED